MLSPGYWSEVAKLDDLLYETGDNHRSLPLRVLSGLTKRSLHSWKKPETNEYVLWRSERMLGKILLGSDLIVVEGLPDKEPDLKSITVQTTHYIYVAESHFLPNDLKRQSHILHFEDPYDRTELSMLKRAVRYDKTEQDTMGLSSPDEQNYVELLDHLRWGVSGRFD